MLSASFEKILLMVCWLLAHCSSCLPLRQGFLLPRSLLLVTPSLQISTISQHFGQPNRMTFLNQQICGLQNSMQSFSSLSYCEMQTNANEMKPTIVPPSYPPSLANLLLGLWVTCSVYANFTTLIKTGSLAKLVLLTMDAFDNCPPDMGSTVRWNLQKLASVIKMCTKASSQ